MAPLPHLYTKYHERILKSVDTCPPVEKVCSIDEMACRLMGTERQVPVARELAAKVKLPSTTQTPSVSASQNARSTTAGAIVRKARGTGPKLPWFSIVTGSA